MIIDNNPIIDNIQRTLTVANSIDISEDVWVLVNGLVGLAIEDIIVNDNIITIPEEEPVDFLGDTLIIMYKQIEG